MATALAREATVSVAQIIHDLESANDLPEAALRLAVPHAAEIAPAVLELAEKAARGVHLMPRQENLLFWGIHVLAAGRRTELCRPLLRLFSQQDEGYVDWLLGDAITETLTSIVISVFDGDPAPLIDLCAERSVEGAVRWNLMTALARLTFDGAVPREQTVEFLDRFERDSLAAPHDIAWIGWAEAIQLLALEEMRERVHATWNDGRNPERTPDQRVWDEDLTVACSLAPGDPGLFVRNKVVALDDPVAALGWTASRAKAEGEAARNSLPSDPAAIFALNQEELRWLKGFCYSRHVRPGSMFVEAMDGFFCGLIAGPATVQQGEGMSILWGRQTDPDDPPNPDYDSPEQAEYVRVLLARHWQTISLRLGSGHLHRPVLEDRLSNSPAEAWALGFLRAVAIRAHDWAAMRGNAAMGNIVTGLMVLAGREDLTGSKLSDKDRATLIATLPQAIQAVHKFWYGGATTFGRPKAPSNLKIGRNEACPCGSGKKYKRCCGARQ